MSTTGLAIVLAGKESEGAFGLDFFGARYFSSAQGRFTSPDKPFLINTRGIPRVGTSTAKSGTIRYGSSIRVGMSSAFRKDGIKHNRIFARRWVQRIVPTGFL